MGVKGTMVKVMVTAVGSAIKNMAEGKMRAIKQVFGSFEAIDEA